MMKGYLVSLFLFQLFSSAFAATPEQWASRTIYQIVTDRFAGGSGNCDLSTYCGGNFQGIIDHLDYIQGMGFDALWISPVVANTPNGYHGYWAQNFYEINPHFGSSADLKALMDACHQRGMYVMFDVVANHVGPIGTDYSKIVPFNQASNYHRQCAVNEYTCFTNDVLLCRLASLPDLNQTVPYVRNTLNSWIHGLVQNYTVDGLRIDTIMYIKPDFWNEFIQSAGVYSVGEVYSDLSCNLAYAGQVGPLSPLSYPLFFTMRNVFQHGQSMNQLQDSFNSYKSFGSKVNTIGTFIDNQDQARFLDGGAKNFYKNALIYTLYSQGIPIIYYGTEQGFNGGNDPHNREPLWPSNFNTKSDLYSFLAQVVQYRKQAKIWNSPQVQRYSANNFYAFTRGDTFVALTNSNNGQHVTITYHPYSDGTKLCNLFNRSGDCVTVQDGKFDVTLGYGQPKIYYPA